MLYCVPRLKATAVPATSLLFALLLWLLECASLLKFRSSRPSSLWSANSQTQVSRLTQPSVPSLQKNGQGRHSCILITASWLSGFLRKYLKLYLHLNVFTFRELIPSLSFGEIYFCIDFFGEKIESITCEKARLPRES